MPQQDVDERPLLAARPERALLDLELQGLESQLGVPREREQLGQGRQIRGSATVPAAAPAGATGTGTRGPRARGTSRESLAQRNTH